ncbi:MAG TPA: large conductance mechanosensitive channel protein MscL [Clostridiales bacterium]|nr:large-conductance mechanosensitive channel protein MscL [Clostridia bacterium]MDD4680249.1 large-conductance mechanosensitive channel protein MscL [Clostridia bacterium]HCS75849.1 large conductance mechanosensitive channel protein MscL [Clostridiales bacterium]
MWEDFKKFALKGNVIDLAVGVVIGGAFGKIVTSLVNDVIMPLLGLITGGINITQAKWMIREAAGETQPALTLNYGQFLQNIIDFFVIALSIFLVIRFFQRFRKKEQEAPKPEPKPSKEEVLLTEIRDLLKESNS